MLRFGSKRPPHRTGGLFRRLSFLSLLLVGLHAARAEVRITSEMWAAEVSRAAKAFHVGTSLNLTHARQEALQVTLTLRPDIPLAPKLTDEARLVYAVALFHSIETALSHLKTSEGLSASEWNTLSMNVTLQGPNGAVIWKSGAAQGNHDPEPLSEMLRGMLAGLALDGGDALTAVASAFAGPLLAGLMANPMVAAGVLFAAGVMLAGDCYTVYAHIQAGRYYEAGYYVSKQLKRYVIAWGSMSLTSSKSFVRALERLGEKGGYIGQIAKRYLDLMRYLTRLVKSDPSQAPLAETPAHSLTGDPLLQQRLARQAFDEAAPSGGRLPGASGGSNGGPGPLERAPTRNPRAPKGPGHGEIATLEKAGVSTGSRIPLESPKPIFDIVMPSSTGVGAVSAYGSVAALTTPPVKTDLDVHTLPSQWQLSARVLSGRRPIDIGPGYARAFTLAGGAIEEWQTAQTMSLYAKTQLHVAPVELWRLDIQGTSYLLAIQPLLGKSPAQLGFDLEQLNAYLVRNSLLELIHAVDQLRGRGHERNLMEDLRIDEQASRVYLYNNSRKAAIALDRGPSNTLLDDRRIDQILAAQTYPWKRHVLQYAPMPEPYDIHAATPHDPNWLITVATQAEPSEKVLDTMLGADRYRFWFSDFHPDVLEELFRPFRERDAEHQRFMLEQNRRASNESKVQRLRRRIHSFVDDPLLDQEALDDILEALSLCEEDHTRSSDRMYFTQEECERLYRLFSQVLKAVGDESQTRARLVGGYIESHLKVGDDVFFWVIYSMSAKGQEEAIATLYHMLHAPESGYLFRKTVLEIVFSFLQHYIDRVARDFKDLEDLAFTHDQRSSMEHLIAFLEKVIANVSLVFPDVSDTDPDLAVIQQHINQYKRLYTLAFQDGGVEIEADLVQIIDFVESTYPNIARNWENIADRQQRLKMFKRLATKVGERDIGGFRFKRHVVVKHSGEFMGKLYQVGDHIDLEPYMASYKLETADPRVESPEHMFDEIEFKFQFGKQQRLNPGDVNHAIKELMRLLGIREYSIHTHIVGPLKPMQSLEDVLGVFEYWRRVDLAAQIRMVRQGHSVSVDQRHFKVASENDAAVLLMQLLEATHSGALLINRAPRVHHEIFSDRVFSAVSFQGSNVYRYDDDAPMDPLMGLEFRVDTEYEDQRARLRTIYNRWKNRDFGVSPGDYDRWLRMEGRSMNIGTIKLEPLTDAQDPNMPGFRVNSPWIDKILQALYYNRSALITDDTIKRMVALDASVLWLYHDWSGDLLLINQPEVAAQIREAQVLYRAELESAFRNLSRADRREQRKLISRYVTWFLDESQLEAIFKE